MRMFIVAVLCSSAGLAQPALPIMAGPSIDFLPPALDRTGQTIAFGSSVAADGTIENAIDLYAGAKRLASGVTSAGLTIDGSHALFTDVVNSAEGIGLVNISSGTLTRQNVDTQGCVRPLALCAACFFACVATPHATADGSKVLFAVRRNQPFLVMNSDGTGLTPLPVYNGALAPAPQRVISADGQVAFTAQYPFGPTFAATATDVYLMNLDGTNIRNLTKFGNNSAIFSNNATISADGKTVVFETNYAGPNAAASQVIEIWAIHIDGSGLQQLSSGPDPAGSPSIAADGQTVVFVQSGKLQIIRPLAALAPMPVSLAAFRYSAPQSPAISDDGQRVAFLLGPPNFSGAVYQINSDGTGLQAVYAPRAISPRGVVSAAGLGLPPSPGGLVTVYGINLAGDAITTARSFPLPNQLANVSVLWKGAPLPLLSVSPWQVNAQLPQDATAASADFQIGFADGARTPPESAGIASAAPDLFVTQVESGGTTIYQAAAFHAGTAIPADDNHPAQAGEILEMYGTGLGVTDPPVAAGQPSPGQPPARAVAPPVVLIGNVQASLLFAGLTPGFAGVFQANIRVPADLMPGRYAVTLEGPNGNAAGFGSIAVR